MKGKYNDSCISKYFDISKTLSNFPSFVFFSQKTFFLIFTFFLPILRTLLSFLLHSYINLHPHHLSNLSIQSYDIIFIYL